MAWRAGLRVVVLHVTEIGGRWYGVACVGERLVATAVGPTRARTLGNLRRSVPRGAQHRIDGEPPPAEAAKTIALLAELEAGDERHKSFSLASEYVPEPLASVLKVAAAVPLGYVTSYGNVARAAGAEARAVGGIMATNPLYPIVPCHRVLGADLSLVGYRGSKGPEALEAKLARLEREGRGFESERDVDVDGRTLRVYPVEWAIAKARQQDTALNRQLTLFE